MKTKILVGLFVLVILCQYKIIFPVMAVSFAVFVWAMIDGDRMTFKNHNHFLPKFLLWLWSFLITVILVTASIWPFYIESDVWAIVTGVGLLVTAGVVTCIFEKVIGVFYDRLVRCVENI